MTLWSLVLHVPLGLLFSLFVAGCVVSFMGGALVTGFVVLMNRK